MAQAQFPIPGQFKSFQSDGGTEFTCSRVQNLLREFGMEHQCSAPGLSSHNGTVERLNRTIQEKTRTLLLQSGFPTSMWGLAVGAAEYIYNRTPHSAIGMTTPYQKWTGLQPDLRHLSIFGSLAYSLNSNRTTGKKFQQVSDPYFLAGFMETGYILYDPKTRKLTASSVKIDESCQYGCLHPSDTNPVPWLTNALSQTEQTDMIQLDTETPTSSSLRVEAQVHPEPRADSTDNTVTETREDILQDEPSHIEQGSLVGRKSKRKRRRKRRTVTVRDAPLTGDEESSPESDTSSDTTSSLATRTSYQSITLPDEIDLPLTLQEPTSEAENTENPIRLQIQPQFTNMPYQQNSTPSTPASQFLFSLRIPDSLNKHDWFDNPHPNAPKTFAEAMNRTDKQEWMAAMAEEIQSMEDFQVWTKVPKSEVPQGTRLLPWKWVYTLKQNVKPKDRLAIIGSSDPIQYPVEQTFSPVPPPYVIHWFLAYAHFHKFHLYQIDIKTAFLHSELPYTRFTSIPKRVTIDSTKFVLKLQKAAYGLSVSPLLWFQTCTLRLKQLQFVQSIREPCLLYKISSEGSVLVLVYVDDILFAGSSPVLIQQVISNLEHYFHVKRLGFPQTYVGFQIQKDPANGTLLLHQRTYAQQLLDLFLPSNEGGHRNVPMNTFGNFPKVQSSDGKLPPSVPYKSIIGSLYYYANGTRPDILFAVNYLLRVQANPTNLHWTLVKQLLRYINSTKTLGHTFSSNEQCLSAFVDADFGSDAAESSFSNIARTETVDFVSPPDRPQREICNKYKSTTGCLITLYGNSIAWLCCKQPAITTSTTESEFVAVAEASTLILFIRELTLEIAPDFPSTVSTFEDNLSTTTLLRSLFHHGRLKHLALRFLKVKELVWNNIIRILPIKSKDQLANILTKPLPVDSFIHLRSFVLGEASRGSKVLKFSYYVSISYQN